MEWIAVILLIFCSTAIGAAESYRLLTRVQELRIFHEALSSIKRAVLYTAGDLKTLLRLCEANRFVRNTVSDADPIYAWETSAKSFFTKSTDVETAIQFIEGFGKTDLGGMLSYIEYYEQITERSLNEAERDFASKGKMNIVVGLFFGTAIGFLLI